MPEKRLLLIAMADRSVWQQATKGRAGIRRDSIVEKVCKDLGGNEEETLSIDKFGGVQDGSKRKSSANKYRVAWERNNHGEIFEEFKEETGMKTCFCTALTPLQLETRFRGQNYLDLV